MTFSIVARCQRTGMLGVAVSTAVPAVGALVPYGAGNIGAIATQAYVNPLLGIDGLALLRKSVPAGTSTGGRRLARAIGRVHRQ
jgi:uncharacterized Ntn-hydrolase superfamily protein